MGSEIGFHIFHVDPFNLISERHILGGVQYCQMLYRTNIIAFIGTGKNPLYPSYKVLLYDDKQQKCVGELQYREPPLAVHLRRDVIVVILANRICIYDFKHLNLQNQITTLSNPEGLFSICRMSIKNLFACPGLVEGQIRISTFSSSTHSTHSPTLFLAAHQNKLAFFDFNHEGNLLVSASEKGTILRLFNTENGSLLREFRRGSQIACNLSIAFDILSSYLLCTSNKSTLHLFLINENKLNKKAKKSYFQSSEEKSICQTSVKSKNTRIFCTLDSNCFYLLSDNEILTKVKFNLNVIRNQKKKKSSKKEFSFHSCAFQNSSFLQKEVDCSYSPFFVSGK